MWYRITLIALVIGMISFVGSWSIILPILIDMPAAVILESVFGGIYGRSDFSVIGNSVIAVLSIVLIVAGLLYYRLLVKRVREKESPMGLFIGFFILFSFVVHPLFFYIHTSSDWSRAGDGQFFMSAADTFPYSSVVLILFGIVTDLIIQYKTKAADSVTGE